VTAIQLPTNHFIASVTAGARERTQRVAQKMRVVTLRAMSGPQCSTLRTMVVGGGGVVGVAGKGEEEKMGRSVSVIEDEMQH
jgi:hypothetical protein